MSFGNQKQMNKYQKKFERHGKNVRRQFHTPKVINGADDKEPKKHKACGDDDKENNVKGVNGETFDPFTLEAYKELLSNQPKDTAKQKKVQVKQEPVSFGAVINVSSDEEDPLVDEDPLVYEDPLVEEDADNPYDLSSPFDSSDNGTIQNFLFDTQTGYDDGSNAGRAGLNSPSQARVPQSQSQSESQSQSLSLSLDNVTATRAPTLTLSNWKTKGWTDAQVHLWRAIHRCSVADTTTVRTILWFREKVPQKGVNFRDPTTGEDKIVGVSEAREEFYKAAKKQWKADLTDLGITPPTFPSQKGFFNFIKNVWREYSTYLKEFKNTKNGKKCTDNNVPPFFKDFSKDEEDFYNIMLQHRIDKATRYQVTQANKKEKAAKHQKGKEARQKKVNELSVTTHTKGNRSTTSNRNGELIGSVTRYFNARADVEEAQAEQVRGNAGAGAHAGPSTSHTPAASSSYVTMNDLMQRMDKMADSNERLGNTIAAGFAGLMEALPTALKRDQDASRRTD